MDPFASSTDSEYEELEKLKPGSSMCELDTRYIDEEEENLGSPMYDLDEYGEHRVYEYGRLKSTWEVVKTQLDEIFGDQYTYSPDINVPPNLKQFVPGYLADKLEERDDMESYLDLVTKCFEESDRLRTACDEESARLTTGDGKKATDEGSARHHTGDGKRARGRKRSRRGKGACARKRARRGGKGAPFSN